MCSAWGDGGNGGVTVVVLVSAPATRSRGATLAEVQPGSLRRPRAQCLYPTRSTGALHMASL